jgi:hypothetical protein
VEFDYTLTGTGWAEARIKSGAAFAHLAPSYLSDALGDLLGALLELRRGQSNARCSWEDEPGEWRWLFAMSGDQLRVRILEFNDQYDQEPDSAGRQVFAAHESLDAVVTAVAQAARRLLEESGEDEYLRRWVEHPFPTESLLALEATLPGLD